MKCGILDWILNRKQTLVGTLNNASGLVNGIVPMVCMKPGKVVQKVSVPPLQFYKPKSISKNCKNVISSSLTAFYRVYPLICSECGQEKEILYVNSLKIPSVGFIIIM